MNAAVAAGQQTVISEHQLDVVLLAAVLGMTLVCVLVVVFHLLRAFWVGGQR